MRTAKTALAILAVLLFSTCAGGEHHSPTVPKTISCNAAFDTNWAFYIESGCTGTLTSAGTHHGTLSTVNGCRLTLDVSNPSQVDAGQKLTMVVNFDATTATLERKGTPCDGIDNGTLMEQFGATQFRFRFKPTTSSSCCNADYFVTIQY